MEASRGRAMAAAVAAARAAQAQAENDASQAAPPSSNPSKAATTAPEEGDPYGEIDAPRWFDLAALQRGADLAVQDAESEAWFERPRRRKRAFPTPTSLTALERAPRAKRNSADGDDPSSATAAPPDTPKSARTTPGPSRSAALRQTPSKLAGGKTPSKTMGVGVKTPSKFMKTKTPSKFVHATKPLSQPSQQENQASESASESEMPAQPANKRTRLLRSNQAAAAATTIPEPFHLLTSERTHSDHAGSTSVPTSTAISRADAILANMRSNQRARGGPAGGENSTAMPLGQEKFKCYAHDEDLMEQRTIDLAEVERRWNELPALTLFDEFVFATEERVRLRLESLRGEPQEEEIEPANMAEMLPRLSLAAQLLAEDQLELTADGMLAPSPAPPVRHKAPIALRLREPALATETADVSSSSRVTAVPQQVLRPLNASAATIAESLLAKRLPATATRVPMATRIPETRILDLD